MEQLNNKSNLSVSDVFYDTDYNHSDSLIDLVGSGLHENENDKWWNILFIYLPPCIFIQGLVGNIISLIVFFRLGKLGSKFKPDLLIKLIHSMLNKFNKNKQKKDNSTMPSQSQQNGAVKRPTDPKRIAPGGLTIYLYLCLLAVYDLGVLVFGLLNEWIYSLSLFDLKNQSIVVCKLFTFFAFLFSHCSSSTIVITTAIRILAVYAPYKASNLTTIKSVRLISCLQLAFFSMFNLHLFWTMSLIELKYEPPPASLNDSAKSMLKFKVENTNVLTVYFVSSLNSSTNEEHSNKLSLNQCKITPSLFARSIWPIADKLAYCILPFLLITLFNVLIVVNIKKVQKYSYTLYVSKLLNQQEPNLKLNNKSEMMATYNQNLNVCKVNLSLSSNNIHSSVKSRSVAEQIPAGSLKTLDIKEKIIQFKKYHLVGKKFTVVLLAISISFLIFTFPVVLTYILIDPLTKKYEKMEINESNFNFERFGYIQKASELLMYLNHSINFFIYLISSFRFRQHFMQLFRNLFKRKRFSFYCRCNSIKNNQTYLYD